MNIKQELEKERLFKSWQEILISMVISFIFLLSLLILALAVYR